MMYLPYEEYLTMGGTLEPTVFSDYEFQAEVAIDYATFDRLRNEKVIPLKVRVLIFHLIGLMEKEAESLTLGHSTGESGVEHITSQSNDGVSVSYSGMASINVYDYCKQEADKAIQKYLYGVKNSAGKVLLYRGLYPGE